ncbi:hypothetical protein ACC870_37545, partial [Rhizobium ruizarguesonis]
FMSVISKKIPAPDKVEIKTALISFFDKTGIVELAHETLSVRASGGHPQGMFECWRRVSTGLPPRKQAEEQMSKSTSHFWIASYLTSLM